MSDNSNAVVIGLAPAIKKLTLPEHEVEPFDLDTLPDALRVYVSDCASRLQTSPDFVAVALIASMAGVIGTRVRIQPKAKDSGWRIVPNVWGALIGAPSSMKSPSMSEALRPLHEFERELREGFAGDLRTYEANRKLHEIRARQAEQDAKKAAKIGNDEKAFAELALAMDNEPVEPHEPRVAINDATVAKLGELLNQNKAGLLLVRDELSGWLAEMQNENKGGDRAFYLEAYNGLGAFTYDRIGRGTVHIENCCLSMIGGIQPSKIAPIVRDAINGSGDDGLLQRFQLIAWPQAQKQPNYADQLPDVEALNRIKNIISRLYSIDPDEPCLLRFDDDAQELFIEWFNDHSALIDAEESELFKAFLIKQRRVVCSLAAIFSLVEDQEARSISPACFASAAQLCEYSKSHAEKLYRLKDGAAIIAAMGIASRWLDLPGKFTGRDIYRKGWSGLSRKHSVDQALSLLVEHGYLIESEVQHQNHGGRPTKLYSFNDRLEVEHFDFEEVRP